MTDVLTNYIYVEELITSTNTTEDAVNILQHPHKIMKEANMNLHKWISNHELLMEA